MILLFVPDLCKNLKSGFLYGEIEKDETNVVVYILKTGKEFNACKCIGTCNQTLTASSDVKHNRINLNFENNELSVINVVISGKLYDEDVLLVYYDDICFSKSYLLQDMVEVTKKPNYFETLTLKLKTNSQNESIVKKPCFLLVVSIFFKIFDILANITEFCLPVTKYSVFCLQINHLFVGLKLSFQDIMKKKYISISTANFLSSVCVDVILGYLFFYWVSCVLAFELFQVTAESVVTSLTHLLEWLMGVPAGLKLNYALNNILGNFYMYHTNLWWMFLVVIRPVLENIFRVFLILGYFGISIQASIILDMLLLVTFHAYCIYAYAARLYNMQINGLLSLWRLFFGKKKNPLRNRVDSCMYSSDQLFIGTVMFTILLFLLPTTLLYYVVFTLMRLVMLVVDRILLKICNIMRNLPVYSTFLWLFKSPTLASTFQIKPQEHGQPKCIKTVACILHVKPVLQSCLQTADICKHNYAPVYMKSQSTHDVICCLLTGNLLSNIQK